MLVISSPCRLRQLLPIDNFDYDRKTSYMLRAHQLKREDYISNLDLFRIHSTWIHSHESIFYAQRLDQLLFPVRAINRILAPVGIQLLYIFWSIS